MVWPHPLRLFYDAPQGLTWALLLTMQAVLLALGLFQLRSGRSALLAGLVWYYLSLLPASRLIVPGGGGTASALAERFLYFASVGPTLVLAFGIVWLSRRHGPGKVILPAMLLVMLLMPVTWVRSNDWRTDVALFEKEYRINPVNSETLRLVTAAHEKRGNRERGVEICERHSELFSEYRRFALNCGMLYASSDRLQEAERVFVALLEEEPEFAAASGSLAIVYLRQGRFRDAVRQFNQAYENEQDPALRELRRGLMLGYLYPNDIGYMKRAKAHFEKAYELQPLLGLAHMFAERAGLAIKSLEEGADAAGDEAGSSAAEPKPDPH